MTGSGRRGWSVPARRGISRVVCPAIAAAAVAAVIAAGAGAVRLPGGGTAEITMSCDNVLRTLDYNVSGPSNAYYQLWAYPYSTGKWVQLTQWIKVQNSINFVGPVSGPQQWYAFYASYAVFVDGRWQYAGQWVQLTYKFQGTTGWWCYV